MTSLRVARKRRRSYRKYLIVSICSCISVNIRASSLWNLRISHEIKICWYKTTLMDNNDGAIGPIKALLVSTLVTSHSWINAVYSNAGSGQWHIKKKEEREKNKDIILVLRDVNDSKKRHATSQDQIRNAKTFDRARRSKLNRYEK